MICEDDVQEALFLKHLFIQLQHLYNIQMNIQIFRDGAHLFYALDNGNMANFICMDIYLAKENGVVLAKQIRMKYPKIDIIFITSSDDYAIEAFSINALHYIKKPMDMQQVQEVLKRYYERIHKSKSMLTLQVNTKRYDFVLSDIIRIESARKGVDIYTCHHHEPCHVPISFMKLREKIHIKELILISRGMMLHMDCISCIQGNICLLHDGNRVYISRRLVKLVKQQFYEYIRNGKHYTL